MRDRAKKCIRLHRPPSEVLGDTLRDGLVQIFGTDVSESAVSFARQGLYAPSIAGDISPERLQQFFTKSDGGYQVTKVLRDMCVFARQDLTRDPPFSRLDLICCRNVLIYMDSPLQRKLLSMFHYALKPDRYLVLGHAEGIGYHSDLFVLMNKKIKVYRKKPGAAPAPAMDTFRPPLKAEPAAAPVLNKHNEMKLVLNDATRSSWSGTRRSVLLDQQFEVVQFNGQTGPYLEPQRRAELRPSEACAEGLSHGLRTALQTARKTRKTVKPAGLRAATVPPHMTSTSRSSRHPSVSLLSGVVSTPATPQTRKRARRLDPGKRRAAQPRRKLEEELAATREYLQSTIQEIEAANEELQSANEEILSSNEELQSTNEELAPQGRAAIDQRRVEHGQRRAARAQRRADAGECRPPHLLASVQIAIVIVARDLRVRRFRRWRRKFT